MTAVDRLSALTEHFALRVSVVPLGQGHLHLLDRGEGSCRLVLRARGGAPAGDLRVSAALDWGGDANPLLAALPEELSRPAEGEEAALAALFLAEAEAGRCGSGAVLNRLGEVIVIRLLRHAIAAGSTTPGLLAGLAEPRLARAIAAMHGKPGTAWTGPMLADHAGLSASRFAELFADRVGESPMAYLRRWRLALAARDLARGDRVQLVASRYGYGSGEAFARAYRKAHGTAPTRLTLTDSALP